MKIATLGSAQSVHKAPFKDSNFEAWVQGKVKQEWQAHDAVPGDWDIWGCSPGCWSVAPRATRWFEVHRWELDVVWFSPEYRAFLRDFKGPVYTGGRVPEIKNHVVYPIDHIEEKFSSYFLSSSLSLMLALAIDEIEQIRRARESAKTIGGVAAHMLPQFVSPDELSKPDTDDAIGLWGVDMAAADEYAYQRPGCQFFILEALRRGIAVYLPAESDLGRPMPVYGISEWDHNYIKLTEKARVLNNRAQEAAAAIDNARMSQIGLQGEMHALNYMVSTWTSPYGMQPGLLLRQEPGTGLGSGITHLDGRPVSRMNVAPIPSPVLEAMTQPVNSNGIEKTLAPAPSVETGTAKKEAVSVVLAAGGYKPLTPLPKKKKTNSKHARR